MATAGVAKVTIASAKVVMIATASVIIVSNAIVGRNLISYNSIVHKRFNGYGLGSGLGYSGSGGYGDYDQGYPVPEDDTNTD